MSANQATSFKVHFRCTGLKKKEREKKRKWFWDLAELRDQY